VERAASFDVVPADVFGDGFEIQGGTFTAGVVYLDSEWQVHSDGVVAGASRHQAPAGGVRRQA
jgi:hypothetical protein